MRNCVRVSIKVVAFCSIVLLIGLGTDCSWILSQEIQSEENESVDGSVHTPGLHSLGAKQETLTKSDFDELEKVSDSVSLPTFIDLTDKFPPVGDQGNQGSCVGWAVGYAAKTFFEGQEKGWDVSDPRYQFSPSWIYDQINRGRDNGAYISDAMNLLVRKGCDTIFNFPYDENNYTRQPDQRSFSIARRFTDASWKKLPNDVTTIKSILSQNKTVIISCAVYTPDFDALSESNPIYNSTIGYLRGYHALCLVGYNDSKRAFKFINSWGRYWGINGYAWLTYDFISDNSPIKFAAYLLVNNITYQYAGIQCFVYPYLQPETVPLFRYWSAECTDHFYTTDINELGPNGTNSWIYEGVQCYVYSYQRSGTLPLYRYWSMDGGDHFYTTNLNELGPEGSNGWIFEGIQCYVYPDPQHDTSPLYRYNFSLVGDHFYTTSMMEFVM